MKKYCSVFLILICFLFSGCSFLSNAPSSTEMAKSVLKCFDNDDVEQLKNLFCDRFISDNLEIQIKEAFEFYEGKSEEIGPITTASQKSVRNGVVVKETATPRIPIYNTDEGKEYVISIRTFVENKDNPDLIGINKINIYVRNNDGDFELAKEIGKLIP